MLFVRRWPAGCQWLLTFQTKRIINIVDSALYRPPVTVPQLRLALLAISAFLAVCCLSPTFSTNVGWCVGVQPTSYALEMSVVCFRTYKRTLLLWTVPFPGFNLGVDTENQWTWNKKVKRCSYIDKTVRIHLSLVFWPLCTVKGQYSSLVECATWVQWNEMTKHINSRLCFLGAFSGDSLSLFHASRFWF